MRKPTGMAPDTLALGATSAILLGVLAGCGGGSEPAAEMGTIRTAPVETAQPELPPVQPVSEGDCPYLSVEEVTGASGTPTDEARVDDSVDPAACFFYDADGAVHLTTTVYEVASSARAGELVTESAPPDASEPAEAEGGWSGGVTVGPAGALAVLARDNRVLAVQSTGDDAAVVRGVVEIVAPRVAD